MLADASAAAFAMKAFVAPVVATLCVLAGLASTFFLVMGGMQYMSSTGKPENLEQAKKIIRNALVGLVLVLAAGALTAILSHAYSASGGSMADKLPAVAPNVAETSGNPLVDTLISTLVGLFRTIIDSIGDPLIKALNFFTNGTPLMGDNSAVFNLWLAVVGITDALFVLAIALIGFHVMSAESLGIDEIDVRHLLPQVVLVFLLVNTSLFVIDGIISLSNGMLDALTAGFGKVSIWDTLANVTHQSGALGLAGLLVMVAFLILAIMLMVYYVGRIIALYVGAILSPLVILLWLLPAFKDFTDAALKIYLSTVFSLFVQVVILRLATSLFAGLAHGDLNSQPNVLMALIVGLATMVAMLKTQGVIRELAYAAAVPKTGRAMTGMMMKTAVASKSSAGSAWYLGTKAYQGGRWAYRKWRGEEEDNNNPGSGQDGPEGGGSARRPGKVLDTGETIVEPSKKQEKAVPA